MRKLIFARNSLTVLLLVSCWVSKVLSIRNCTLPDEWMEFGVDVAAQNFRVSNKIWTNGIVKYHLNASLTESDINEVYAAFEEYHKKTCIRFEPKNSSDIAYVNIELDDKECGLAEMCMKGKYQYVKIGSACRNKATVIHELGHSLCLAHEHQRADRDKYVTVDNYCIESYSKSYNKSSHKYKSRGLYDYASQMHYWCDSCINPKDELISKCGENATSGLSVLDADYLNELYNCQGCFSHRWVHKNNLTVEHRKNMFSFGLYGPMGWPVYPCRGYIGNDLSVGWVVYQDEEIGFERCWVLNSFRTDFTDTEFEVLTIPGGLRDEHRNYKLVKVDKRWDKTKLDKIFDHAVIGGRVYGYDGYELANLYIGYLPDAVHEHFCNLNPISRQWSRYQWRQRNGKMTVIGAITQNNRYESTFKLCDDPAQDFQTYFVLACVETGSNTDIDFGFDEVSGESYPDETSVDLPQQYSATLSLYEGESRIVITGYPGLFDTEFIVDLMENEPNGIIALRFNPSFSNAEIVRNSYSTKSGWGTEERGMGGKAFPFTRRRHFALEIRCGKGQFRFYVNDNYVGRYKYYQPLGRVNFMRIMGSINDLFVISQ